MSVFGSCAAGGVVGDGGAVVGCCEQAAAVAATMNAATKMPRLTVFLFLFAWTRCADEVPYRADPITELFWKAVIPRRPQAVSMQIDQNARFVEESKGNFRGRPHSHDLATSSFPHCVGRVRDEYILSVGVSRLRRNRPLRAIVCVLNSIWRDARSNTAIATTWGSSALSFGVGGRRHARWAIDPRGGYSSVVVAT
jgi:hypothetical protein